MAEICQICISEGGKVLGLFKKKAKEVEQKTVFQLLNEAGVETRELPPLKSNKVPPPISELQEQFERESKICLDDKNTTEINKTALAYLGYGLDCIDFAKAKFGATLTLVEKDIYTIEEMAGRAHKAYMSGELAEKNLLSFAKCFAGYMGLIILIHKGGEWVEECPELKDAGPGIMDSNGSTWFVLSKSFRRIQNGDEDNLVHFYQSIKYS